MKETREMLRLYPRQVARLKILEIDIAKARREIVNSDESDSEYITGEALQSSIGGERMSGSGISKPTERIALNMGQCASDEVRIREMEKEAEWLREWTSRIDAAIEGLTAAERQFVKLRYHEQRSMPDIAGRVRRAVPTLYRMEEDALKKVSEGLNGKVLCG